MDNRHPTPMFGGKGNNIGSNLHYAKLGIRIGCTVNRGMVRKSIPFKSQDFERDGPKLLGGIYLLIPWIS